VNAATTPRGALRILDVELTEPLPSVPVADPVGGPACDGARILVRLATEPLGELVLPLARDGLRPNDIADGVRATLGREIADRLPLRHVTSPVDLPIPPGAMTSMPYLRERDEILASGPHVAVVVATRDRPDKLERCMDHLDAQVYGRFSVVVVDNAPRTDAAAGVVERHRANLAVSHLVEPRPGLSWARNLGWRCADGDIVAFLDDDEVPDPYWLCELVRGFRAAPGVGCVSGMILPLCIDTPAQAWFEQYGGHSKGRGFTPAVFAADRANYDPLYPLPPFGAGGNMAIRRDCLDAIGGFDVALGAGTPALSGEDTLAFTQLLLAGYTMVYQPTAIVRHEHYADIAGLSRQLHGYGAGLSAYYTALVRHDPALLGALMRLAPKAAYDMFSPRSVRTESVGDDFPRGALRAHRRGLFEGAFRYARSRSVQRRVGTIDVSLQAQPERATATAELPA
jgi:GT2 family glycosyltransferase